MLPGSRNRIFLRMRLLYCYNIQFRMREEIIEPNIKYSKIGQNRRKKLIDLVVKEGYKVRRASKMLKINQSTAKSILKLYRTTGTLSQKAKTSKDAPAFQSSPAPQEKPPQDYSFGSPSIIGYEEACPINTTYLSSYCPQFFYGQQGLYTPFYLMFPNTI